jgi:hypothetical protein
MFICLVYDRPSMGGGSEIYDLNVKREQASVDGTA